MLLFRLQGTRNIIVLKRRQQQQQQKKTRNSIVLSGFLLWQNQTGIA